MTGACATIPVVTAAHDLAAHTRAAAVRMAADLALDSNRTIVIVGRTAQDTIVFCSTACCLHRMGTFVVVPDVDVLLWVGVPEGSTPMQRNDGRTAYVMPGARTWNEVARITWPEAGHIAGEGQYATVRRCAGGPSVMLHSTHEAARAAMDTIHPEGSWGRCLFRHSLVVLGEPTDD